MDLLKLVKVDIWWDGLTDEEKMNIYDICQINNKMTDAMIT